MPIGTLVIPDPADVRAGRRFGADGELVGTLSPITVIARQESVSSNGLLNSFAFVLEFRLAPEKNMDAKRVYYRRMTIDENGNPCKDRVPCRVSSVGARELMLHSMRGSEVSHRVYFDANPNLREENRLEINGGQYILLGIPMNPSLGGVLWQLDVKLITQQNELIGVIE